MTIKEFDEYLLVAWKGSNLWPRIVAERAAKACGLGMAAGLVECSDGFCEVALDPSERVYYAEEV